MSADELDCSKTQVNQAAAIIVQLEILRASCQKSGNAIGDICCQIAITALTVMTMQNNPPKTWESKGGL
jgi:hypothetical protein